MKFARVHVIVELNVFLYFGRIHWMAIWNAWRGQLQRKCAGTVVYKSEFCGVGVACMC